MKKIGPKEAQARALRERKSAAPRKASGPGKKIARERPARKPAEKAAKKAPVPAVAVGAMICRPVGDAAAPLGGASMDELVKKFKIAAHPMRAKIHYLRHELGYEIEIEDGRYRGKPPEASP